MINDQVALTMDLLPTLLDLIGQEPGEGHIDGISIKESLLQQAPLPQRDVFFEYRNKSFIRSGDWKQVHIGREEGDVIELYNLSNDLPEKFDVSADHPVLVNELLTKLETWKKEVHEGAVLVSN